MSNFLGETREFHLAKDFLGQKSVGTSYFDTSLVRQGFNNSI